MDYVTADHMGCDAIVHYGDACLSLSDGIPVFYAFQDAEFDEEAAMAAIRPLLVSPYILIYHTSLAHVAGNHHCSCHKVYLDFLRR